MTIQKLQGISPHQHLEISDLVLQPVVGCLPGIQKPSACCQKLYLPKMTYQSTFYWKNPNLWLYYHLQLHCFHLSQLFFPGNHWHPPPRLCHAVCPTLKIPTSELKIIAWLYEILKIVWVWCMNLLTGLWTWRNSSAFVTDSLASTDKLVPAQWVLFFQASVEQPLGACFSIHL